MRDRFKYMIFGSILVTIAMILTDPDLGVRLGLPLGAGAISTIGNLATSVLYVTMFHISFKGLFDYLDRQEWFEICKQSPTGAGLGLVAMGLFGIAIAILIHAATN